MYRRRSQGHAIIPPDLPSCHKQQDIWGKKIELWGKDIRCSQRKRYLYYIDCMLSLFNNQGNPIKTNMKHQPA